MFLSNELFVGSVHNPHDSGWHFGSGNPELWKYAPILIKKGGTVLDLGMGYARSSLFFALNGMEVTGYDLDRESIKSVNQMAKDMNLPIKAKKGDIREVTLGKDKFDVVLLDYTFVHSNSIKEVMEVIDRAYEAVSPGGHIWIRAYGKHDETYDSLRWRAQHNPHEAEIINDDVIKTWCDCSGELVMEPILYLGTTDLIQLMASKNAKFIETETAQDGDSIYPNIMYGEDWHNIRPNGEAFGVETVLAQKPIN